MYLHIKRLYITVYYIWRYGFQASEHNSMLQICKKHGSITMCISKTRVSCVMFMVPSSQNQNTRVATVSNPRRSAERFPDRLALRLVRTSFDVVSSLTKVTFVDFRIVFGLGRTWPNSTEPGRTSSASCRRRRLWLLATIHPIRRHVTKRRSRRPQTVNFARGWFPRHVARRRVIIRKQYDGGVVGGTGV